MRGVPTRSSPARSSATDAAPRRVPRRPPHGPGWLQTAPRIAAVGNRCARDRRPRRVHRGPKLGRRVSSGHSSDGSNRDRGGATQWTGERTSRRRRRDPSSRHLEPVAARARGPPVRPRDALDEEGKRDSVEFFAPMVMAAYRMLGPLDLDQHYDLGRIGEVTGGGTLARAEADTILRADPTHLLGLALAARVGLRRAPDGRRRGPTINACSSPPGRRAGEEPARIRAASA